MSNAIRSESAVKSKEDLPPPRDRKGIRPVKLPLSNVPLHRFNYYMALFATLLLAFYAWRLTAWKAEVGGWWNLAMGKKLPTAEHTPAVNMAPGATPTATLGGSDLTVEDRISQLASALGMPSKDLASAIASAVHDYVPPASLSSIAAYQTGDAVSYLVDPEHVSESDASATPAVDAATKGFKVAQKAFDAAVGMDEPPTEI